MKLWMACEAMADVGDSFRLARIKLENAMNEKLAKGGFGLGDYEKWAVIAIIRPDNDPDYPEIKRVNKARKVIEFRLKVDHASFLNGTDRERISLLAKMLSRSLDQMAAPGVRQVEIDALKPLLQDFL